MVMHLVKILFVFNARRVKIVTSDPVYRDKLLEQPIGIISKRENSVLCTYKTE